MTGLFYVLDGYYTVTLPSGMKAVTLNTNYYFTANQVYSNLSESDPGYQFSYLENVLKQARENSTKVCIWLQTLKQ